MAHKQSTFTELELQIEEWRDVVGYEGIYSVSNLGRVRRDRIGSGTRAGRILKPHPNDVNCECVSLCVDSKPKGFKVHYLVAVAFHGPCPDGHEVNHKDTNRLNNRQENIEWKTHAENMQHAKENDLMVSGERHHWHTRPLRGERHPNASLTEELVREIKRLLVEGMKPRSIGRHLGIESGVIYHIRAGNTWTHI